jgi:predicted RND superfamily exporter protein
MSFWYTSEIFSSFTIMKHLQQEKYLLITIKFVIILIFLTLFTGVLGIFVTLTTLLNFLTCMAILTLLNYKLTIENMSYFVIVLIVCSQYSVLYSIRYSL